MPIETVSKILGHNNIKTTQIYARGNTISNLEVYPNPSRDVFNVEFTSEGKQSIELRVVNLVGEIIYVENLENF